jgi:transcriptional regulator with XRE-family HTH domain
MDIRTIQDIGAAIRAARLSHSMTQEQAAALCGVSLPFMNQLEGGRREHLSFTKVLGVCAALGLRLEVSGAGAEGDR